ncbi:MAG: DUF58 domain-containing protein [Chloroflexi bacterium]|nr:DUF58 domain-containing protein [Chloroflexota bacterium]
MFGEGWHLAIAALLVTSLVLRSGLLFVVSLALLLVATASRLWDKYCLTGVEYRRHFSQTRAFFGEEVELTVEITNRKLLPLAWLEVEDELPTELEPRQGRLTPSHKAGRSLLLNLLSLRWYERVRRHYRLRCDVRGYHSFGPATLRSGDLFGFYRRGTTVENEDHLLVYPRVVPLGRLGLPAKDPFGDRKARQWLFEDPLRIAGTREYVYGDSLRRVDWKATARTQRLQVRLHEPTTTYRLVIFLNLNTFGGYWWWLGYDRDLLELSISVAASVANWATEQGYQVGLLANGNARRSDQTVKVVPSRDPNQLTHILEALAKVLPFATMPLEGLLRLESNELPYGATLVVVTAVLNEEITHELLALKAAGHRIALLLVGDQVPSFHWEGIAVYRIGGEATWRDLREIAGESLSVP